MTEENIAQDLKYHRNKKIEGYLGAALCAPGLFASTFAFSFAVNYPPVYYRDYNVTGIIAIAGFMAMISSSVGLIKSINDAGIHRNKIKELEDMIIPEYNDNTVLRIDPMSQKSKKHK